MTARTGHDAKLVIAILMVTMAMGMLDAISLLHLKIFAGYMTATIILMAVNIATSQAIVLSGLEAIACYFTGAIIGGRLVRRERHTRLVVGDILLGVGCLVGLAAFVWCAQLSGGIYITLGMLSLAWGCKLLPRAMPNCRIWCCLLPLWCCTGWPITAQWLGAQTLALGAD